MRSVDLDELEDLDELIGNKDGTVGRVSKDTLKQPGMIVERVYDDTLSLQTSLDEDRGDGALYQTKTGRNYLRSSTGHLATGLGFKVKYNPDHEVNVQAMISAADGGDICLALRRSASEFPGRLIRLPSGLYSAATIFEVGDLDSALIWAHGGEITVEDDITFFRAAPPAWEEIQTINTIDGDDYWGPRKAITVTDGTAYAVRDLVKVVSDDKQRCTRAAPGDGTDYRRGFMAYIEAISGNVVTLDRPVPWDMTTKPRIGRMPKRRFAWKGGLIRYEEGHDADWHGSPMHLYGVSDLSIDVEIGHSYNSAINATGCMEPIARAVGKDLRNDEYNAQYGYLINNGGSQGLRADIDSGANRHGFTTNMPLVAADSDDLHFYGAAYGGLVTGQSNGNSQAGFDTHHGSENITFASCVSSGGTTGGGQFVLRGIGHKLINPQAYNGKDGILFFTEDGVTDPSSAIIESANVDVDRYPLLSWGEVDVEIHGGSFRSRKYGRVVSSIAGSLKLRGTVSIKAGGPAEANYYRALNLSDCAVDARGAKVIFDLQDVNPAAISYGAIQGDGDTACSWIGGEVRTFNDSYLNAVFYKATAATAVCSFAPDEVVTEKLGVDPTTNMITGAGGVGFTGPVKWRAEDGTGRSAHMTRQLAGNNQSVDLLSRGDDHIVCEINATGAARIFGVMPDGVVAGQKVTFVSSTAGSWDITFQDGAAYNMELGGSDVVLSALGSLTLVWLGSTWMKV
ncbi:hypothetical protein CEW88_04990 [Alloyangia pacifica]|uniref:Depolymerase 2 capsule K5-specific C-terminal domain-containing protein n=1 Tax=Alloyangia pacifica TaxID=311180 RepID=A0A2U8HBD8_9RHOB|nr:hypothetical protein CEW88_04990 [Alloyangia pacifica]